MSASSPPHYTNVEAVQNTIDSYVQSLLFQSFFSGLYTLIFLKTAVTLVQQRKRYILGALIALYITVILDFVARWQPLRLMIVTHDETRDSIIFEYLHGSGVHPAMNLGRVVSALSAMIVDGLLTWRCYYIWMKNKWVLAVNSVILFAELVLLPVFLTTKTDWGIYFDYNDFYWLISLVVTTTSTALIIYRILDVSRMINKSTSYNSIIEILVESAALYTVFILICGILLIARACRPDILWLFQFYDCISAIQTPVAGIAPTLVTLRVATGHARADEEWSEPVSNIVFRTHGSERDAATVGETVTLIIGLSLGAAPVPQVILDENTEGSGVSI